jgi:hypothetical protein
MRKEIKYNDFVMTVIKDLETTIGLIIVGVSKNNKYEVIGIDKTKNFNKKCLLLKKSVNGKVNKRFKKFVLDEVSKDIYLPNYIC